jgi:hypothetical protein
MEGIMNVQGETGRLVNLLRQTARMSLQAEGTVAERDTAAFCANQYNRILARLMEIDDAVSRVFVPLETDSSLQVAAMACRQLAAYYEDEMRWSPGRRTWRGVVVAPGCGGVWLGRHAFRF